MVRNAFIAAQADPLFADYPVEVLEDIALISVATELLRLDDYERRSISKFYKGMRQL